MLSASKILIKRSSTPGSVPSTNQLESGELALNLADKKIFFKNSESGISFVDESSHTFLENLSSIVFKVGSNNVTGAYSGILGGYNNDVSGSGSTTINGENNDIAADYALIGGGVDNIINASGDYGAILGGTDNTLNHQESFIIGSNITSHASNFTYVNNLSATDNVYGDGSGLTNLNATNLSSGTVNAERMPAFNGDITTVSGTTSATVVSIQGNPVSVQNPANGQILQWNGAAWVPGSIATGGSGGGGVFYYFNYANNTGISPTNGLPTSPVAPSLLGREYSVGSGSLESGELTQDVYTLVAGFVSLSSEPAVTNIPAGLWDFNIWVDIVGSTSVNQTSMQVRVYKYTSSTSTYTPLASSENLYIYDPTVVAQYIVNVTMPQTTLLSSDRIYIEFWAAKSVNQSRKIRFWFDSTHPSHVHTTLPSVAGSGLVKTVNGVYQTPASLLVNSDVASNAAISPTKIAGLTDIASKANDVYTTVQANSSTNWNNEVVKQYTHSNFLPLSGGTITGSLSVLGNVTYLDTAVGVTSAMYIDAATTEPALRITQSGTGDVIRVEDTNNPDSTPFIINSDGVVGVGTSLPNEKLTVVGNISATGFYYGDGTNLTGIVHDDTAVSTLVRTNSANWDAAYTGVSSLSSALSAVSSSTSLSSSVTSDVNVGGIAIAQVIPQNTTFQGFVEALLTKIYYPVLTAPSASISSNIGTEVEVGTQGITLTVNLNRGAITGETVSGIWDPNTLQDYRSGAATQYVILGVNNGTTSSYTSATAIIQDGTNTFSGSVTHASGPQPVDSKNQNYSSSLASGTLSTSVNVYGRRKAFYGVNNNAADSSDIRSLSKSLLNPSNGSTFQISIPIGTTNVVFAYPSSLRNVTSVLYVEGFDSDVKDNFTQTTVSVQGSNSYSSINYKVYKYTPVQAFTKTATYNVTI